MSKYLYRDEISGEIREGLLPAGGGLSFFTTVDIVAKTDMFISHNLNLGAAAAVVVAFYNSAGDEIELGFRVVDPNSIRIYSNLAIAGLQVFIKG